MRKNSGGEASSLSINIPRETLTGIWAGVIALLVLVHVILGILWLVGVGHLTVCKNQWQKLAPDKKILDAIYSESKDIKTKYSLISGLTIQKQVLWSPKFNAISDSLSRGLWLRQMILNKDVLSMDGSVVSKSQNEIANVGLFIDALKQNEVFIKDFSSIEVNSIQRGRNNAVEVTDFTVMAKLK